MEILTIRYSVILGFRCSHYSSGNTWWNLVFPIQPEIDSLVTIGSDQDTLLLGVKR